MNYGPRYLHTINTQNDTDNIDPVVEVFPRVTKCDFAKFGPSGDVIVSDALCVLPLNIVNEKIYVVMWVWLMFLVVVTSASLVYRLVVILLPSVRTHVLIYTIKNKTDNWELVSSVCSRAEIGDWFVLRLISKNVDNKTFTKFLNELVNEKNNFET